MIVNAGRRAAVLLAGGREHVRVRCLARRGMLHSECEAVDRVGLAPGAHYALTGRDGTEAAWYVLRGTLTTGTGTPLHTGDLLLAPHGEDVTLRAGPEGADLLCLTLTPPAVTRHLPPRTPDTTGDHTPEEPTP
ncbi:hypothetical protein GCM10010218_55960 [Streptomyces mashuensis]|uniref:Uncharacterized protein n=1 Tax=Streptomyces mashuensis TaxID=33904 RepID=A0A919B9K1_9ACTN|nr:cupin domain-containing protein [Streptomyces mashuensis]GHF67288.1 hypothetical protein GCM10010218_55960 [Streptomyces mashuensis]